MKNKNIYKSTFLLLTFIGIFLFTITTSSAAESGASKPPSLNITIGDSTAASGTTTNSSSGTSAPPALNINIGSSGTTASGTTAASGSSTPPSLNINISDSSGTTSSGSETTTSGKNPTDNSSSSNEKINITNADASPKGFNPAVDSTKISYKISQQAIMEIRIENDIGETVNKLIDNENTTAGNHYVYWSGNKTDGQIVSTGTYKFKILAKNPLTNEIEDTAQGEINIVYFTAKTSDPENKTGSSSTDNTYKNNQANATTALNNDYQGNTSETGPETLVYLAFPLAAYLISRLRNRHG